jgi:hypothetical protein
MAKKAARKTDFVRSRANALIPIKTGNDRSALVPENPRIKGIAFRWRWRAETVVRRVEDALPSVVERMIYVDLALGYRIHPESLRKMLDVFRGDNPLTQKDLEKRVVGVNLVKSKFDDVVDKVEQALSLIDKTSDSAQYMMSMANAAHLVEVYGSHAEEVLGQIVENIADVARYLNLNPERSSSVIVGVAVTVLIQKLHNLQGGETLPLTVEEMFRELREAGRKGGRLHE